MHELAELDRDLFLFLNDLNAPWLDQTMFFLTNTLVWLPLYAYLMFLIYRKYGLSSWIVLIGIALTIALSDQITSSILKPLFERLRPSRDPSLEGMVHIVNGYRGGLYGFASSHAANTFGVAAFLSVLFYRDKKGIVALFAWAAFVSYTRIYLGVHYPGDIMVGAIIGAACAFICVRTTQYVLAKASPRPTED